MNGGRDFEEGWEREIGKEGWYMVSLRYEDGVWGAGQACENVRSKVLEDSQLKKIVLWARPHTFTGHIKYLYRINTFAMANPKMIVQIHAPTKPSTVFLGESLMSWVRPKAMPQM